MSIRRTWLPAILLAGCLPRVALSDPADVVEDRNKSAVQASFAAWRAGTGSPFDLLAEDATWTIVGRSVAAGTYAGRQMFFAKVVQPFNARLADRLKPVLRDIHADGDSVIVLFDVAGTGLDGAPYSNTYAWFLRMQSGSIVEAYAFFDTLEFNEFWHRASPERQGPGIRRQEQGR